MTCKICGGPADRHCGACMRSLQKLLRRIEAGNAISSVDKLIEIAHWAARRRGKRDRAAAFDALFRARILGGGSGFKAIAYDHINKAFGGR